MGNQEERRPDAHSIPESLTADLRTFGTRSWPEVKRIIDIAA